MSNFPSLTYFIIKYSTFHTVEEFAFVGSLVQKQDDYSATLNEMEEPNLGNIQVESNMALTIS